MWKINSGGTEQTDWLKLHLKNEFLPIYIRINDDREQQSGFMLEQDIQMVQFHHPAPTGKSLNMADGGQDSRGIISALQFPSVISTENRGMDSS